MASGLDFVRRGVVRARAHARFALLVAIAGAAVVALDAVGALVWSAIWVGLGWIVGDQWQDAAQTVSGWLVLAGAVVMASLASLLALRAWRRRARGAHAVSVPTEMPAAASREWPRDPRAHPRS